MDTGAKREKALAALRDHTRRYGVAIPKRLLDFYAGDFDAHHLSYAEQRVPGFGGDVFQLALTPPTWLGKGDDAITGPRGEWADAKHYVPLFVTDQALYVVADLRDPACPIGWFSEETASDGVVPGAASLDAFLSALTKKHVGTDVFRPVAAGCDDHAWALEAREEREGEGDAPRAFDVIATAKAPSGPTREEALFVSKAWVDDLRARSGALGVSELDAFESAWEKAKGTDLYAAATSGAALLAGEKEKTKLAFTGTTHSELASLSKQLDRSLAWVVQAVWLAGR